MAQKVQVCCKTCQDTGWVKDSKGTMLACPKCSRYGEKD